MMGHREDTGSLWVTERTQGHDGSQRERGVMMGHREDTGS